MAAPNAIARLHTLRPPSEEVVGTHLLHNEDHLVLLPPPHPLDTPIQDLTSLSNTDISKCFVEVDMVGMSISGTDRWHTLAVVPF